MAQMRMSQAGPSSLPSARTFWLLLVLGALSTFLTIMAPPPGQAQIGRPEGLYYKSWGIIIGIDDYLVAPKVPGAIAEAKTVRDQLRKMGFEEIVELYDKDASFKRLNTVLMDFLPRKVARQDRLVVYFSGHAGVTKDRDGKDLGYLVPWDAQRENVNKVITLDLLKEFAKRVMAKHVVFILNAGVSGWEVTRAQQLSLEGRVAQEEETEKRAIQVLTAGAKGESLQQQNGQGLFTAALIEGLQGAADDNKNGWLLASELGAYVTRVVGERSKGAQHPQFARLEGDGDTIFIEGQKHRFKVRQPTTPEERVAAAKEEYEEAFTLLQKQRPPHEAVELLDKAIEHDPAYGDAHVLKSYVLLEYIQDVDGALRAGEVAVQRAPKNADAHYTLGLAQQRKGQFPAAEKSFLQALALNPDYADAHLSLGDLYALDLKDKDKAVTAYTQYLKAGGQEPRVKAFLEQAGSGQK
jgi:tetratricopeptide (TPR) repeat protein